MVKNLPANARERRRHRFDPWIGKIFWRRKWQSTPVFFGENPQRLKSLEGYSLWCCKESDMTEQLDTHTRSADKDLLDSLLSQLRCIAKARNDMQLLLSINSVVLKAIYLTQLFFHYWQ